MEDTSKEERAQPVTKEKWDDSYLDFNEDSISMTSYASTVQSSFVRHRIQEHELKKLDMIRDQTDPQYNHNNVVINFVLNADNSQAKPSSFTVAAQTSIPEKVDKSTKKSQWNLNIRAIYTKMREPKYIICLLVLICALIGSTIGLHLILKTENKAQSTDTTTSVTQFPTTTNVHETTTTSTPTVSTSTASTTTSITPTDTTQLTTITEPSTTEDITFDSNPIIITRKDWEAKPMTGSKKQSIPIDRVIFMQTYTDDSCITEVNCNPTLKLFLNLNPSLLIGKV